MRQTGNPPKIVLIGAAGRMGNVVTARFLNDGKVDLTGAVDIDGVGEFAGKLAGIDIAGPRIFASVGELPDNLKADIALDFSVAEGTRVNIVECLKRGWDVVIGATGFDESDHGNFMELANQYSRRIVIVPNFTPGINLLLKMAEMAGKVFPNVEIIEMHHDRKLDAPSGTAIHTAKKIAAGRKHGETGKIGSIDDRSRGRVEDDVPIHAVRLPGLIAHQEVIFGSEGEVLTIRHDTTDRAAFLTGIYLAIEHLHELEPGFTIGLEWVFS